MMNLLVEAVVVAFCVGGAVGVAIALHLQPALKRAEVKSRPRRPVD